MLLCVDNPLMADYADENARLIRDDPRLATWMTGPTNAGFPSSALRELAGKSRHRCVPYWVARAQWWDLIIFADYRAADRFHPDVRKVLVNHFLGGGKIIGGKEYRFERKLSPLGPPLFTSILEASHAARQRAITAQPVLANHVRVVGDLRSDHMLSMRTSRDEIRRTLGFQQSDIVVLIQSTWGAQSIMERWGGELLQEAIRLMDDGKYRFIASTHPHHWHGPRSVEHPWGEYLLKLQSRGLVVIKPGDDWAEFMVASDVAISDNTSLGATYCQLERPMIFIDMPADTIPAGSTVDQLYNISPHLCCPKHLESVIREVLREYPYERLREIAHQVNSFPGQAAERIRAELYRLLEFS